MKATIKLLRKSKSRSSSLFEKLGHQSLRRNSKRSLSQSSLPPKWPLCSKSAKKSRLRNINRRNFFGNFGQGGSPNVENSKLYQILGVEKTADAKAIKRAYLKKVKENHPDKGGDTEKFKEINGAYEILGDQKKREMYDQYGMEGMKNQMGDMGDMGDIFDSFFRGGQTRSKQKPKMKTMVLELKVDLKDLFDGAAKQVSFKRDENCKPCNGEGGKNPQTCRNCKGTGIITKMVSMGPGMYSQSQSTCGSCQGQGKTIKPEDICKTCQGQKNSSKIAKVEIQIPKGAPNGFHVNFPGEGDQHPEAHNGDLLIKLIPKPHPVFKKKKSDLYIKHKISLFESLSGFKFNVEKLDGTKVTIKTEPGEIIQHKQLKKVSGLGLPIFERNYSYGDLYIEFLVDYPQRISQENLEIMKDLLPQGTDKKFEETKSSFQMKPAAHPEMDIIDEEDTRYSQYDDGQGGEQKVDCANQ